MVIKNNLKVSVIMNVHNGEKYIAESIKSVINQSYTNWELVIWDNISTDKTFLLIKKFKDLRIKYYKSNKFDTLYAARNKAIGKAEGVAEAAVVGYHHDIKGQGIYAFVTLMTGVDKSNEIFDNILDTVKKEIGPHAKPDKILFTPALPKTRSGKIMRRILRKIAEGDLNNMGDTSTLADPSVVDSLISSAS